MTDEKRMSWADVVHWLAQGAVNMAEGVVDNTFVADSKTCAVIEELCCMLSEGKVVHLDHVGEQQVVVEDEPLRELELITMVADGLAERLRLPGDPQCRRGGNSCVQRLHKSSRKPMHAWPLKKMCAACAAYWHATQCAETLRESHTLQRLIDAETE